MFREVRRTAYDDDSWEADRTLERAFPPVDLDPDHPLSAYLGFEQNDAVVLGASWSSEVLELTIDHYNVWRLASTVRGAWDVPRDRFPATLRFEGVRELRAVLQAGVGEYRLLRSSLADAPSTLWDVIALKCVGVQPGSLRFHLRLNSRRRYPMSTGGAWVGEIDLLIDCARAGVSEDLRLNWAEVVGAGTLPLLEEILGMRGTQFWAVPDFERFVAERMSDGASG